MTTSDTPEGDIVQCPKCRSENPADVAHCANCGESITQTPARTNEWRLHPLTRVLLSLSVGIVVFAIASFGAYRQFCSSAVQYAQRLTFSDMDRLREAIDRYRLERKALPANLGDLPHESFRRWTRTGVPGDWWGHPLHYWTDGSHYRVSSYGRDGKSGGIGLDLDLSTDMIPQRNVAKVNRPQLPPLLPRQATPTFQQFVSDRGENAGTGSGRMMFLMTILTAAIAFALSSHTLRAPDPARLPVLGMIVRLFVTAIGTLIVAFMYIIPAHIPSGH